jgi:hypothetical protein
MLFRRWILFPLAFSSALFAYLSLEKLTGGDPAFFRTNPKPFVAPPPEPVIQRKEIPSAPEITPAMPAAPVLDWVKLPPQAPPRH